MNVPPILVIIFNRPEFTQKLFEVISQIQPEKLYVISDGPRNEEEALEVKKSRAIFKTISWPGQVKYNYADTNMGLRQRISSGIDWAFEYEEKLIILEDDCIPHPSFFRFCDELLSKYENDTRVMTINGCNLNPALSTSLPTSYFYSKYANSWGWATWKRAWSLYDRDLSGLDDREVLKNFSYFFTNSWRADIYWHYYLNRVKNSKINSWAYRWMFSLWIQNGLAIVPKNNLIQNIGIDERSSNTKGKYHYLNIEATPISNNMLSHPKFTHVNISYDKWLENTVYSKSLRYRLIWLIKKITLQI